MRDIAYIQKLICPTKGILSNSAAICAIHFSDPWAPPAGRTKKRKTRKDTKNNQGSSPGHIEEGKRGKAILHPGLELPQSHSQSKPKSHKKRRVYNGARQTTFSNTFFSKTQKNSEEKTRVTQRGKTGRVTTKRRGRPPQSA